MGTRGPGRVRGAGPAGGVRCFEAGAGVEYYVAVDEGVGGKTGLDVLVSVRKAISGTDLGQLREAVQREFMHLDEQEKNVRSTLAKMEGDLMRRMATFHEA